MILGGKDIPTTFINLHFLFLVCTGLGVANTDLEEETTINAINIKDFNKNCTIIQGSVHIKKTAFDG